MKAVYTVLYECKARMYLASVRGGKRNGLNDPCVQTREYYHTR